ncbi:MAG TPA: ABC transporter permease [Candidatus Acidoferrales bacterium]|nr:ABC transporter permease [Candidatus Acidoferrales bacterium]
MKNSDSLVLGLAITLLVVAAAIFAPLLAPYSPTEQNLERDLWPVSKEHWLGADKLGRDVLSRLLYGGRASIFVGVASTSISLAVGFLIGATAGYFGGWTDELLMRAVDVLLAFPGILLAIALTAILGPGLNHVVLALCLIGWTAYARLTRGEILSLREREFIHAARALGASPARIVFFHLLPNLVSPLTIQATFNMSAAILAEGALSFLGLGTQPPTPSWGNMLSEGRQFLLVAPHLTVFPGGAIMITVLGLNLLGDALADRWRRPVTQDSERAA